MIRRALARSLIGLLALAPLLPVATGRAAPRRPTSRVAQAVDPENRTDPAPEQTVSLAADEDEGIGAPTDDSVPDLEERLYLRERPDSLGAAAREYRDERIAELLAQREALAHERRLEAIALLERFLATEPETAPEIPDALLRLAELRWELARLEYLRAFADFQARPEGQRGVEPTIDYSVPLALYERILVRHRDFDRRDLVLYMKGYALLDSGQTNQALDAYRTILRDHPESRFVPDSHFALAEDAFTNRVAYRDALAEYEAVLRYPRSELYDIALFKSAWCLWRLGRNQDAALRFRQVLDLGAQTEGLTAEQRRRLRDLEDEALDYLIQVFTEDESNTARDVFRFLQEIGGERYANRVMRRLADTYMSQGRQERAVEAYGFLLEMEPESAEAPDYQRTIAAAYVQMGELDRAVEALRTLGETYGPDSRWASQQGDPEVVARAERRTEK
ncbi:MAG: tetratricopeptide repeat protein, partial [Polyangiales bacterium]